MKFGRIGLRQFRNIKEQNIEFNPGLNVLRGQNGQGKTNLIEAIYLLTHGRSFRTNDINALINKKDASGFFINTDILKKNLTYKIEIAVSGKKKELNLNGKKVSTPRLRQQFSSVLFSPESLLIVKDSAQKRRDLIDDLCLSLYPEFASILTDYKRLMKQKNNLLKRLRDDLIARKEGELLNSSLTQQMFEKGAKITLYRLHAIEEIEPLLLQEFLQIMDEHYGNISINYSISGSLIKQKKIEDLLNAMYKRWEELKLRELATGLCLVGPHKHDIQFNFNDQDARFYCSQGQQRAIILAFKMAQTRLHYRAHKLFPILLLDDVLSELDREKQMRFVNYLLSTEAQIFLTTTDATVLPEVETGSVFGVKEGNFTKN